MLPASLHSQTATRPTAGSLSAAHSKLRHWMEQSGKDARPGRFTLEEKPSLPIRKYGWWDPKLISTLGRIANLTAPADIRTPDRQARSMSLHLPRSPGFKTYSNNYFNKNSFFLLLRPLFVLLFVTASGFPSRAQARGRTNPPKKLHKALPATVKWNHDVHQAPFPPPTPPPATNVSSAWVWLNIVDMAEAFPSKVQNTTEHNTQLHK